MATDPLEGRPEGSPNPGADPVNQLAPKSPGQPSHDDHDTSGPPPQEVIARGYEADVYDAKTVLSVPVLVILFFVLAFGTVTILFWAIAYPGPNSKAHPGAVAKNDRPLNERLMQNYRGEQNGDIKNGDGQPRLEPLKLRSGRPRAITSPELPLAAGNSPELHPEDIRPTPEQYPELYDTADKVGLGKVMELGSESLKGLFPVQKDATGLVDSRHVPSWSNAGRGADRSQVVMPPLPKDAMPKVEGKNPEEKKEPKKDGKEPKKDTPPDPKGGKQ